MKNPRRHIAPVLAHSSVSFGASKRHPRDALGGELLHELLQVERRHRDIGRAQDIGLATALSTLSPLAAACLSAPRKRARPRSRRDLPHGTIG